MLTTICNFIETFVSVVVKLFYSGYILGKLIIHISTTVSNVVVALATTISSYAVAFYDDVKIFMLDIEYQYGHIIKMLNNGINNAISDLLHLTVAIISSIEWISERTKTEASKLFNGSQNLLTSSAIGLRNMIVLIGNSAWMLIMCIPNLVLAFGVIVLEYISSIWKAIIDSTIAIAAAVPECIRKATQFVSSVPLQSLCGLISIYLLIKYRSRVCYLLGLTCGLTLRLLIQIEQQIRIGCRFLLHCLSPIRNYSLNLWGSHSIQEDYAHSPPTMSSNKATDSFNFCVICQDKLKSIVLLPCRHLCLCLDCYKQLRRYRRECPMCRRPYDQSIQVYA